MTAPASSPVGAVLPTVFDAEAFVDDLIDAGCHVSVHQPIGRDAGAAYVWVAPTIPHGIPTMSEREVRARWRDAIAACPDHEALVLAVCQRRVGADLATQTSSEADHDG